MAESICIDEPPDNKQHKANWTQLIHKAYEVDSLKCTRCSSTMRIIALIDDNIVARETWLEARIGHLEHEKEFTRLRDERTQGTLVGQGDIH